MKSKLLLKLINTSEREKIWIESFVKDYGFDNLVKNIDAAAISNRTKQILLDIDQVLHNGSRAIQSLASITEIPAKSIEAAMNNDNLQELMEHPERLDIDSRQLYKLRCLDDLHFSYMREKSGNSLETSYLLGEGVKYDPER